MRLVNARLPSASALTLMGLLLAGQAGQASECKVIKTRLDGMSFLCGNSPVGLCSDGVIASGILKGTKVALYTAAAPGAGLWTESPFVFSYSADAVFATDQGELHLNQLGVLDTSRQVFTEVNRVVGGTGRFRGASGDLFISGTMSTPDIATDFESEITGTVCLTSTAEQYTAD